jgi:DNA topoisomerase-1
MKNLIIVESPSKSKTIEKYLGKDYKVLSSKGHIRDLSTKGKGGFGIDIENDFKPDYVIIKDKGKTVKELKEAVKKSDKVFLATDPDREGEAISWHLAEVLGLEPEKTNRAVFNEVTKDAVEKAIENPRSIDMDLVRAQETRRFLDRIIGFSLSSLLRSKIKSKSAGRVQSVALKMICDLEKKIKAFVPEEYWTLTAKFNIDDIEFDAELSKVNDKKPDIKNEEEANRVFDLASNPLKLTDIKSQVKKRKAYPPFTTSTLQQAASSKYNFTARKTMSIAQALYEGVTLKNETVGLITYMRTDSTRLSNEFVNNAQRYIESTYGKEYVGKYFFKKEDGSQDAHEAIRPTDINRDPLSIKEYLSADQYKLYSFIYYRALASLMSDASFDTLRYSFSKNGLLFVSNGSKMKFDGFLKAYKNYDQSKDTILPELTLDQDYEYEKLEKQQHFTEPPARYTEARLIKALEEEGIGRPSTYATIVDTIVSRGYVELVRTNEKSKTRFFVPTEQGLLTDEKLAEFFSSIINIKYTRQMEEKLDEIAENNIDYLKVLKDFYGDFEPLVQEAKENMEKIKPEPVGETCPECGGELVYRVSRTGDRFISCANYPKCKYSRSLDSDKVGELCPECGGELVYRHSRFGKFISCSNYPQCKYIRSTKKPKEPPVKTGLVCPDCGGELVKRRSRYGKYFLGCSNYPKCRHIENIKEEDANS